MYVEETDLCRRLADGGWDAAPGAGRARAAPPEAVDERRVRAAGARDLAQPPPLLGQAPLAARRAGGARAAGRAVRRADARRAAWCPAASACPPPSCGCTCACALRPRRGPGPARVGRRLERGAWRSRRLSARPSSGAHAPARPPAGVVLDVMFTNGLSAVRALAALGVPAIAVDHRRSALGLHARGVVPVLAPDPLVDEAGYLEVLAEVADASRRRAAWPSRRRTPAWCWWRARRRGCPGWRCPGRAGTSSGRCWPSARRSRPRAAPACPCRRRGSRTTARPPSSAAAEVRYPAIVKPSVGIAFKAREGRPVIEADGARRAAGGLGARARRGRRAAAAGGRARRRRRAVDGRLLHRAAAARPRRARSAAASWPRCRRASAPAGWARRAGRTRPSSLARAPAGDRGLRRNRADRVQARPARRYLPADGAEHATLAVALAGAPLRRRPRRPWPTPGHAAASPSRRRPPGRATTAAAGCRSCPRGAAGRAAGESRCTSLRQSAGLVEEPILSLRDPVPGARVLAGAVLGRAPADEDGGREHHPPGHRRAAARRRRAPAYTLTQLCASLGVGVDRNASRVLQWPDDVLPLRAGRVGHDAGAARRAPTRSRSPSGTWRGSRRPSRRPCATATAAWRGSRLVDGEPRRRRARRAGRPRARAGAALADGARRRDGLDLARRPPLRAGPLPRRGRPAPADARRAACGR